MDSEEVAAQPLPDPLPELEDWNAYADKMRQRAISRLLALAMREAIEGRITNAIQLISVLHGSGVDMGKNDFALPLQRYLLANEREIAYELDGLRTERTLEQLIQPLIGKR